MKRRFIYSIILALFIFSMTGCGENYLPDLSEKELANCEEYAVKLLLKYNNGTKSDLLSEDDLAAKEQKIMDKAELQAQIKANKEAAAQQREDKEQNKEDGSSSNGESGQAPVYSDIDEFLGLSDIDIDYSGYSVVDSYPTELGENDFQGVVHAGNGNKLIVLDFNLTNKSSNDCEVNIPSLGMKVAFKVNGQKTKVPLTTMLFDDMFNFKETIVAGETKKVVLLIEMSESDVNDINNITMTIKANGIKMDTTIL